MFKWRVPRLFHETVDSIFFDFFNSRKITTKIDLIL